MKSLDTQPPRKLLSFHQTEDRFWPDFTDIKHEYTQEFYRPYTSFISQCPRTSISCQGRLSIQRHWHQWDAISAVLTFWWHLLCAHVMSWDYRTILVGWGPGASPTNDILIEFEIRLKLSWHLQNFAVIGWSYLKLEHSEFLLNFKFDRNTLRRVPGGWFNIKMTSYQYRKSHCGDKTILRPSYLHNGISYTGKMASLYWISPQGAVSIRKTVLPGMAIPMLKIRRPNGRLIFNMEIAIRR